MKARLSFLLVVLFAFSGQVSAQDIVVSPFLQSATPNEIWIVWETSVGSESRVEWGATTALGTTAVGSDIVGDGSSRIHHVHLTGLEPATRYFYRVHTGSTSSETFDFMTPPLASAEQSFRVVAISDMQRGRPGMFREIMQDGIRDHVIAEYGPNLSEELALMVIPGDLVDSGLQYREWEEEFFAPGAGVFEYVPMYPVLGNHENDSQHYFDYFHLPENGSDGSLEHWYHVDYSNVRIIGLDSTGGYRTAEQLAWLDAVLDSTCTDDNIDFVFAQMHHPYLSELWKPGESSYSGDIVQRLETFSTACKKPSIHMFGHTHAYSRGQSRDHRHLWVNVASAGGSLDHWGDYDDQTDYDELTVSEDEFGFVVLEVSAGDDPSFRLKRYSRGDDDVRLDNVLRDDVTIRLHNQPPGTPTVLGPIGDEVPLTCTTLSASTFFDADGETHDASHWQLSTSCDNWETLEFESWKQHQNIYYNEDLQAGDDLTDDEVLALSADSDYCIRVRYRDSSLGWSEWSEPLAFHTAGGAASDTNLLSNPGAEDGTNGWAVTMGFLESLTDGECSGVPPHTGEYSFAVGGVCESAAIASAFQRVDVGGMATEIDGGNTEVVFGGYLRNFSGGDVPEVELIYRGASGDELGRSERLTGSTAVWTLLQARATLPVNTRSVDVVLTGTRTGTGEDNDSYMDDLFLRIATDDAEAECQTRDAPMGMPDAGSGAGSSPDAGSGLDTTPTGGCGCQAASGHSSYAFALMVLLFWRRSRRGREHLL